MFDVGFFICIGSQSMQTEKWQNHHDVDCATQCLVNESIMVWSQKAAINVSGTQIMDACRVFTPRSYNPPI